MKKRAMSLILALVLLLALCACGSNAGTGDATGGGAATGGGSTGGSTSTGGATTADYTQDDTAKTSGGNPISVATAQKGGDTVVIANAESFTTTDEFSAFTMTNKLLNHLWGDSLVEMDYDTGEYVNALAESIEWSDDYLTAHVTVRQGVPFSNGDEMTAEDVAFSYERIATGDLPAAMSWSHLVGAEATGDYTLDIHFNAPMPNFYCESCAVMIINKKAYEANPDAFWSAPIATGPYKWVSTDFVSYSGKLELWNENWWGYAAHGKEPSNVKNIEFRSITEDSTRVSSLRAGEIHIATGIPYDDIATVKNDGLQILRNEQNADVFLCINVAKCPAFQDVRVRQAMSLAIDRDAIVSAIVGNGKAATWPVPEKSLGYRAGNAYEYNPEKAVQLLQEAGYDGSPIELGMSPGNVPKADEVVQAIASYLQAVGISCNIVQMEQAAWNDARFSGEYQMQMVSFAMVNGESWKIMDEIVGRIDFFKMNIDREDAWQQFDQAMVEMDQAKRSEIMADGYAIVNDQYDPIYLYDMICAYGVADNLEGMVLNTDNTCELRFMTLK